MTSGRLSPEELKQLGDVAELFLRIEPNISMDEYYGLTLMLLLVFGVVFELPLVLAVLAMLGIVSAGSLWRWNRYAILVFAIGGAILTPGDLVVGQLAMTGSLTVLYNLSIVIAWLVQRKRTRQTRGCRCPLECLSKSRAGSVSYGLECW
jgi:Sec-independent protein secretion pathway component TatC